MTSLTQTEDVMACSQQLLTVINFPIPTSFSKESARILKDDDVVSVSSAENFSFVKLNNVT